MTASPLITPSDIILLVEDPSATLPLSVSYSLLLSFLDDPPPSLPVTTYLSAILTLLSRAPPPPTSSFLSSLLLSFLSLFHSRQIPRGNPTALLLRLFSPLLPALEKPIPPSIIDAITADLAGISDPDDAQPLDLLPHLLDQESVNPVVDKFLQTRWSKALLLKIVPLLRDLPDLSRLRVSELLEKVFEGMRELDVQDVPTVIYQLLVLASKGVSKKEVVRGILGFFEEFSSRGTASMSIARQVEGTVLMHVNFAVKQDPSLGQEAMAAVRSNPGAVSHFAVAVLLSVARVRRFNEGAVGVLRSTVVNSQRDYKVSRDCKWLPDKVKEECLETAITVEKALIRAVNESNCGREHVVPSIVQFGFVLLESADGESSRVIDSSGVLMGIEELGIQILKTLFEVHDMARSEIIEQCKFRILSLKPQQSNHIIRLLGCLVQSYPYPMLEYVSRLKELLDYFTFMHDKTSISVTSAILPLIKFSHDLQDYIILVVRKAMFKREDAVRIAATNAIVDLILTENKSKKVGLNPLQDSSSQASCSQQVDIPFAMGGGLFQELSGLLRRCLSQQAGVKEIMYEGLIKLVLLEPTIAGPVFDLLWPHFLNFYHEDADSLLSIDACFKLENGKTCLVEPLDCLLSCVSWILLLQSHGKADHPSQKFSTCFGFSFSQDNEAGRASSGELFSNALSKIRKKLINSRSDVPAQSQGSLSHSLQGEKTYCRGWVLLGTIEVFVNIIASELEKAAKEEKSVLQKEITDFADLYSSIEKETDSNKQGIGSRKGSSATTTQGTSRTATQDVQSKADSDSKECPRAFLPRLSRTRRSFFATSTIHELLVIAVNSYSDINSSSSTISKDHTQSSSQNKLNQGLKLITFTLKACLRHLRSTSAMGSGPSSDPLYSIIFRNVQQLGRPIMQLVWLLKSGPKVEKDLKKKDGRGKKIVVNKGDHLYLSLLCLNELFKVSSSGTHLAKLIEDLNSLHLTEADLYYRAEGINDEGINDEQEVKVDDQYAKSTHLFIEKVIKPIYSGFIALSLYQETEVLSDLLMTIGKAVPCQQRNIHGTWAVGICSSTKVENPNAARSLVKLSMHLLSAPNDLIIAHDLASELLKVMGSEDKGPTDLSETFPVINCSTKNAVSVVLLQLVESSLSDLDWAVLKMKSISTCYLEFTNLKINSHFGERSRWLVLEESIYSRSEALVYLLSSFAEMNLKDSQAEQLLKLSAKFYKLLARMTKLCIAPKGCKQLLPGPKFQKLAEVTCKKLTSPLYNFVELLQRNQRENVQSRGIISKIKRESRCVPDLIFQIEDYERYLIQLGKLTKVNLLRHAKRSTARDFKILETKTMATPEQEPGQVDSASSENESCKDFEGQDEENAAEKVVSPASGDGGNDDDDDVADAAEVSETDKEDEERIVKRKRVKMSRVVQDSDEDS